MSADDCGFNRSNGLGTAMGYVLHVTRAEFWAENDSHRIEANEWIALIESDASLAIDERNGRYFAVFGSEDESGWIDWKDGNLYSMYPRPAIFAKLLDIADLLRARVQGDDGEVYESLDDYPGSGNARVVDPQARDSLPRYLSRKRFFNLVVFATIVLVIMAANVFDWW